jgi:nucleoside-diphosphate-sugar epimerase
LGRFTTAAFLRQGATEVLGLGRSEYHSCFSHRLPNGDRAPLPRGLAAKGEAYRYESCELRDSELLRKLLAGFRPSHVLHLAGAVSGSSAEDLDSLNLDATDSLLKVVAGLDPQPLIIMASTGSIYGEPAYQPQDEEHPVNPVIDYAQSKWKAEQLARALAERNGLTILFARIFNLVGPGTPTSLLPGSLALQLAAAAHRLQAPVIRMGPLTAVRDYVDVRDCAEALRWMACSDTTGMLVVNVASGRGTAMTEVWEKLRNVACQRGGPPIEVEALPPFPAHSSAHVGDTRRLAALGFRCAIPVEQSLADLYDWALLALKPGNQAQIGPSAGGPARIPLG